LINSLLFILIGLELRAVAWSDIKSNLQPIAVAIVAFLVARAFSVYALYWLLNLGGLKRPPRWAHILFWGGLRGSIPIALLLGLSRIEAVAEYWNILLVSGFAVVVFSLVGQGLTMQPLLKALNIGGTTEEAPAQPTAGC
jgi:CPA1 family monovalent cation:H+ antiporter